MEEKDNPTLKFAECELYINSSEIGNVPIGKTETFSVQSDDIDDTDIIHAPAKKNFSISFSIPELTEPFKERAYIQSIKEAQEMLDRLRDYQNLWRKYYGFGQRRERRRIERSFNALAQRLAIHCRMYGITIQASNPEEKRDHIKDNFKPK